jgi:hypothetical protein
MQAHQVSIKHEGYYVDHEPSLMMNRTFFSVISISWFTAIPQLQQFESFIRYSLFFKRNILSP